MSVLIKGMDMPENCYLCRFGDQEFGVKCKITGETYTNISNKPSSRPSWCPLVELPSHGRLIDADAFIKDECGSCDGACETMDGNDSPCQCDIIRDLRYAPTIMEAEVEE